MQNKEFIFKIRLFLNIHSWNIIAVFFYTNKSKHVKNLLTYDNYSYKFCKMQANSHKIESKQYSLLEIEKIMLK